MCYQSAGSKLASSLLLKAGPTNLKAISQNKKCGQNGRGDTQTRPWNVC